VHDCKE
jgi:hypothetical protein